MNDLYNNYPAIKKQRELEDAELRKKGTYDFDYLGLIKLMQEALSQIEHDENDYPNIIEYENACINFFYWNRLKLCEVDVYLLMKCIIFNISDESLYKKDLTLLNPIQVFTFKMWMDFKKSNVYFW